MGLFDRSWRSTPRCPHDQASSPRSDIGQIAVRRYYWVCNKCGGKVYIEDWRENTDSSLDPLMQLAIRYSGCKNL